MPRYAALLRGINVGGKKLVSMAELRELLTGLGHTDVATVLQSGNAVFTSSKRSAAKLAAEIERALGIDVRVLVRTHAELAEVIANNPLPGAVDDPAHLLVNFLDGQPDKAGLDPADFPDEDIRFGRRELYVWYRKGIGRSKLTNQVIERRLGVAATGRNWNTLAKLVELTGE
jgi:uncharacterized protein (DUF1697 family)